MNIVDIAVAIQNSKDYTDQCVAGYTPQFFDVTLLANGWTNLTQIVSDSRITATGGIFPASSDTAYYNASIKATAQAAGSLTFEAATVPLTDIIVHIACFG